MGVCPCKVQGEPVVELVEQDACGVPQLPSLLTAGRSAASTASCGKHPKEEAPSPNDGGPVLPQPVDGLPGDGGSTAAALGEDNAVEDANLCAREASEASAKGTFVRTLKVRGTVDFLEQFASEEACLNGDGLDYRVSSSESEPEVETEPSGGQAEELTRPDFSGTWLCVRVEGDWDAYLKETGVSWGTRVAVSSMGFGVGKQVQHIEQTKDRIRIVNVVKCCPPREASCTYRTDGVPEEIVDLEGKHTTSTTSWQNRSLVTEQVTIRPREVLPTAFRNMRGQEMCTERFTKSGLVVRRFYARQK
mmetsp:Transcript_132227/g.329755  ORF Transcript_132227/g.329755 Transcript_132227/m.329755 type:complete len:305 (-) Transcript_132227:127-1041(-)